MNAKDFYSTHMVPYDKDEVFEGRRGYKSIRLLEFLEGKPWDDVALAFVHSLRPSSIRVTSTGIKLDARTWRVTVYVDDDFIEKISQEVEVGLPKRIQHGEHLGIALHYGLDSPQSEWYEGEHDGYMMDGINGIYYKRTKDGLVPFPKDKDNE